MNYRRDPRASKSALFDGYDRMEEGLRNSSSGEITDHDNDKAVESLQDRVMFLKTLTGDIHEEVESHNRMLDKMVEVFRVFRSRAAGIHTKSRRSRTCRARESGEEMVIRRSDKSVRETFLREVE